MRDNRAAALVLRRHGTRFCSTVDGGWLSESSENRKQEPPTPDGSGAETANKNEQFTVHISKAHDLKTQRTVAGKIQNLLLDETPLIISYFSKYSRITSSRVQGLRFTAISHLFLDRVSIA